MVGYVSQTLVERTMAGLQRVTGSRVLAYSATRLHINTVFIC